jgi:hypothetical protein
MMGGGTSDTTSKTDQSVTDQRTGAEGESVAIGAGATVEITTTDPGAMQLGIAALSLAETSFAELIEFANAAGSRADGIVKEASEGGDEKAFSTVKFLGGAAVIAAALVVFKT